MARKPSPPSYCRHKATGQAFTRVNGRMIYLGEHDSRESRQKWAEIISDWSSGNLDRYGASVSISRLSIAYLKHAEKYYLKNGKVTSVVPRIRSAMRGLVNQFGNLPTDRFLPSHLEKMQQFYLKQKLSRKTINEYTNIIRQAFRFGVTKGSVPAPVWQALLAVRHLQRGRTEAREPSPVDPVHPFVVIQTLRHLGPVIQSMVRLQYLTGMRPGEICMMKLKDLDRSDDVWKYSPESHKTVHHGRKRTILLGRKAQRILFPYLQRSGESFIFSPSQTHDLRYEKTSLRMTYSDGYTSLSYCRAITRICQTEKIPGWTPNQLRHTYATIIRKRFGLEAAQILLGHSKADVTQIYAERDIKLAEQVAREVG